ncbi:MAG: hypothetical protein HWD61_04015 [Parachlamydiaceae bacterium]|nr:MAG: hypothetical protein HWD61_04015 [Parachlamydiaceae bacterium]
MQVSSENFISPPIDAKAHQHPPTKSSPYRALPIYVLKASGNLILSGLGSLAVLAIRLASLVLSIFGHCGQSISQKSITLAKNYTHAM